MPTGVLSIMAMKTEPAFSHRGEAGLSHFAADKVLTKPSGRMRDTLHKHLLCLCASEFHPGGRARLARRRRGLLPCTG